MSALLRLRPAAQIVWRSPSCVQLGVEEPIVVDAVTAWQVRLLEELRRGVPEGALPAWGEVNLAAPQWIRAFLKRLAPVLTRIDTASAESAQHPTASQHSATASSRTAGKRVLLMFASGLSDDDPLPVAISTALGQLPGQIGTLPPSALEHPAGPTPTDDIAILVSPHVTDPRAARGLAWRSDRVLPIVTSGEQVTVGPFVAGAAANADLPCLGCVEHARTDADPAWPVIAAQLIGRSAPPVTALLAFRAAATLLGHLREPAPVSVTLNEQTSMRRMHRPHPECACRSLPGIVTPPLSPRSPTTTASIAV